MEYTNCKKCVIIFSGFNQRAIIAFLRTLEKNNISYAIVAKSLEDNIFLTKYKEKVLAVRQSIPIVLEDLILALKKVKLELKVDEYIIIPTTEALNRFLLDHREKFKLEGYKIPLVSKELYEQISNKYSFGQLCIENNIYVPLELDIDEIESYPIVAKPKKYYSNIANEVLSPIIIKNEYELNLFKNKCLSEEYYFQEYIEGRSFYLLYYFSKDGAIYKFSQENLIQQPNGKSMVAAISSDIHNLNESCKYEELFKCLEFFGLVMVEVKQKDSKYYMIEANPRFWGPSQLFVDAGINLFEAFLYDLGMLSSMPEFYETSDSIRYFWLGGIVDTYKKGLKLTYYQNDENSLISLLPIWLQSDIYRRFDTIQVFKKEVL